MEQEIFHALLPLIGNIAYVGLSMAVGYLWNMAKGLQENREKVEDGVKALLKDRLISIHSAASKRDYITYTEMERATAMYEAYHGLGGNGTGTLIMEELKHMRIQKEEECLKR